MKKKFIALLLTFSMLICSGTTVFAADEANLDSIPDEMVTIDCSNGEDAAVAISNDSMGLLYELEYTKDYVYSTDYLNVRQRPTILSDVKTVVCPGHKFYRVAHSDFGWDLVMEDEEYFFVWNEYLTSEEPESVDTTSISTPDYDPHKISSECLYSPSDFQVMGVIYYGDYKWTWYSERILPGGGLSIPGRHDDENGYVCDENDYICLASSDLPKGTVVSTPFGKDGKVYDCGCASGTLDVYVNW